ncbi:MAG: ATP synthase subunit I [Polyangiaceae bacterium]
MEANDAAPPPSDEDPKEEAPPEPPRMEEPEDPRLAAEAAADAQRTIRAVTLAIVGSGVVLSIGAAVGFGPSVGVAALVGAALAVLNLVLFARLVQAFMTQKGQAAPWAVLGSLKLVGLFACVYLLVTRGGVSAYGIALGFAALPIGITLGTLFRPKPSGKEAS